MKKTTIGLSIGIVGFIAILCIVGGSMGLFQKSTDLSMLTVNGLKPGVIVSNSFSMQAKPIPCASHESQYTVCYDALNLQTDQNNRLTEIYISPLASVNGTQSTYRDDISMAYNNERIDFDVERIKNVLGNHYRDGWYDRGQDLKAFTYVDKMSKLNLKVVYSTNYQLVVWMFFNVKD